MSDATLTKAPETELESSLGTLGDDRQSRTEQVTLAIFIIVPFLAVAAAVPVAWGGWLGWHDVVIAVVMLVVGW